MGEKKINKKLEKIPVLNFGTFHMGLTSDASKIKFDEHKKKNQKQVHAIAKMLSSFNPTVILVEHTPKKDLELLAEYKAYLKKPKKKFKAPTEIELLAFELGRICNTKRIHGIGHKLKYNYKIGRKVKNKIDSKWHDKYYKNPMHYYSGGDVNKKSLSLLDKLKLTNKDDYLDFAISANADMLTHVGSKKGFEGADEAAKYYQRNLRMYSNMNRISLDKDDRVFILMGCSHTAFFRDFISRSPKYKMVNTFAYLD